MGEYENRENGGEEGNMSITWKLLILASMIFCHIADDYYLQGILSKMKQRAWWRKNAPDTLYANDYLMALAEHAFSWSFIMSLPLMLVGVVTKNEMLIQHVLMSYFVNTMFHGIIDDLKANVQVINLVVDQCLHLLQVFLTWEVALVFF